MSESDMKSIKIIPWDGNEENWLQWSRKFKALAICKGFYDILIGKVTVPTEEEYSEESNAEEKRKKKNLIKLNADGYGILVMCMDDLKSANLVQEHEYDLRNAWLRLCEEFEPTTGDALVELIDEFQHAKLDDAKKDISAYISDMENKRQRLKELQYPIDDKMFMIKILSSLPKDYILLTATLKREVAAGKIKLVDFRAELKATYMALKKANDWSTEETAFYTDQKKNDRKFFKEVQGNVFCVW
jgi:gag-polypeptide of LTR copia-type